MISQIKLNNILKIIFTYEDTSLSYYLLQLTSLSILFHFPPVTRVSLLYIFTIIWPCLDESRCTRYSNGISHVCSLVHALVQNNPRTHIRYRINSVGSKKEEKRKKKMRRSRSGSCFARWYIKFSEGSVRYERTSSAKFDRAKREARTLSSACARTM